MARTPSNSQALGTKLPKAALPDVVSGQEVQLHTLLGRPAVVAFMCNHCPFVKHLKNALGDFSRYCQERPSLDQKPSLGCNIKWKQ